MGCGNSSQTSTESHNNSSICRTDHPDYSLKMSDDSAADEDKRKNYGGVYVGLPTDLSNIPTMQIGSLQERERDSASLRKPLWGNGVHFNEPEICRGNCDCINPGTCQASNENHPVTSGVNPLL